MARADYSIYGETKMNAAGFNSTLSKMESAATRGLAVIGSAVAGAVTAVAGIGVNYNAQVEQLQTSFEVMTGSAEEAAGVIENLKKVGAETPFELTDLAETTQLLMNYGFSAEEAQDRLMMLGDISQGSAEKMNRIATAYGQMSSAGKVSLEDIKQMIEAGFNPLQEISESTGESMASLYDRISKGTISIDEITASMQRSTSEGGKYFQSMEKQSQTFSGQLSTLKDNALSLVGQLTSGLSEKLTSTMPMLNSWMSDISNSLESGGIKEAINTALQGIGDMAPILTPVTEALRFLVNHFQTLAPAIMAVVGALAGYRAAMMITSVIQTVTKAINTFKTAQNASTIAQAALNAVMNANPFVLIATVIGMVVTALVTLFMTNEDFRNAVVSAWESVKEAFHAAWDGIVTFFTETLPDAWNSVVAWFNGIPEWWNGIWSSVKQFFSDTWNSIISFFTETIPAWIQSAIDWFNSLPEKIGYAIGQLLAKIVQFGVDAWNWITVELPEIIQGWVDWFAGLPGRIWDWLQKAIDRIRQWGSDTYNTAKQWVNDTIDEVIKWFESLPGRIQTWLQNTIEKVSNWGHDMVSKAKTAASDLVESVTETIKSLPGKVYDIGKDIVTGIWDGIKSMVGWIGEKIGGFVDGIVKGFTDGFDIGSPSKVLSKEVGRWLPPGITVGVEDAMPKAERSLQNMVDDMIGRARGSVAAMQSKMAGYTPHFEEYEGHGSQQNTGESLTIEVPVDVDGREIARATAKYFGPRLAWEG